MPSCSNLGLTFSVSRPILFKNVITQIPQAQQIIPLNNEKDENSSDESYEFEPDEDEILSNL